MHQNPPNKSLHSNSIVGNYELSYSYEKGKIKDIFKDFVTWSQETSIVVLTQLLSNQVSVRLLPDCSGPSMSQSVKWEGWLKCLSGFTWSIT